MTKENIKKLREHYKNLIAGAVQTGNAARDELIKTDAARHLKDLDTKHPEQKSSKKTDKSEAE